MTHPDEHRYEYVGFLFKLEDGRMRALPDQHPAAYREKHARAALECYENDLKTWQRKEKQS